MYFDEEAVLDLRLNVLDKYVDYFVIVESNFTHRGEKRSLKFNHKKFEKFKNKIIYLIYDEEPKKIEIVNESDSKKEKSIKYILNAALRENGQRDHIIKGLDKADKNDFILISDVDEIPNLSNVNFKNTKDKILMFQQDMFYYKFDLKLPDIKDKKYSLFRLDIIFSKKKYSSIKFINNGGWHFSNIKSPKEIEHKLRSYLHHREFDEQPLTIDEIDKIIQNRQAIYDLKVDKRVNKVGNGSKLIKYNFEKLPNYLKENKEYYQKWLD